MGTIHEIWEYAKELAYSLDDGATEITAAPWNEWCKNWRDCGNLARGSMLMFKKTVLAKQIKIEVWEFYSHTASDGVEGDKIFEADRKSMKKIFNFYFKK
ncbi:MAG: hypothetical protein ACP5G1_04125 [Nanopusillaceae archaeon]